MTAEPRRSALVARVPRPTRSAALLLLLATILELLGQLIKSSGVMLAAAAALGAIIGDAALAPRIDGFSVSRDLADRLTAGIGATFRLTVETPAGRRGRRRCVVLRHHHLGLSDAQVVTPSLVGGGTAVAVVPTVPPRRGHWTDGGHVTIEAYSPLGGFVRRHRVMLDGELWVHPAPATALRLPEAPSGRVRGSSPSARAGAGTDFFGIREWRTGDAATAVHWRASARRNQLVVMERERPSHAGVLIVCGPASDDDAWEPAVARAAATGVAALRGGRSLALLSADGLATPTTTQEILDFFATLPTGTTPTHSCVSDALRTVGSGTTMVWLAAAPPTTDVHQLVRAAGGVLVVPTATSAS